MLRDASFTGYDWSFFLVWAGVGFSFVSAALFSGAAVCLRSERIKEETVNMQYLMPGNNSLSLTKSIKINESQQLYNVCFILPVFTAVA